MRKQQNFNGFLLFFSAKNDNRSIILKIDTNYLKETPVRHLTKGVCRVTIL